MTRKLYFLRHGKAAPRSTWEGEDGLRPLTPEGEALMRREAKGMRRLGLAPDVIITSPLVRARQTAELLARHARLEIPLIEVAGLGPGGDPRVMARRINRLHQDVAIVGHEPHLSMLGSLLVTGAAEPVVFVLKKCAALALEREDAQWMVRWHVSPELLA